MKKKPCRNIYDNCIEDTISSDFIVQCSPTKNDHDKHEHSNENDGDEKDSRSCASKQVKRKLVQESESFHEKKRRRSANDNSHQNDGNDSDDDRKDLSAQCIITPSPAIFQQTKSRIENVKEIAIGLNLSEECTVETNNKNRPSTQSPHHYGMNDGLSTGGKSSGLSQHGHFCRKLPSGVRSIVCPYLKSCSSAIIDANVKTEKQYASDHNQYLFPCACAFLYNDTCGVINIESYLVSYLDEYIESLKTNEFNIGPVSKHFFPRKLSNKSAYATTHQATKLKSSFSQDRFCYYMDYIRRFKKLDSKSLPIVTPNIRAVLVDWLIEVAAEYNLGSITLHTAVGLVDRCLASEKCELVKSSYLDKWNEDMNNDDRTSKWNIQKEQQIFHKKSDKCLVVSRRTIQLLGCGCMMISSKIHEVHPPDTNDFRYISASQYSIREITTMEKNICAALAFNLHIRTPHHFANIYLRASYVSGNALHRPVCSMSYHDSGFGMKDSPVRSKGQLTINFLVDYFLEIGMLHYEFSYLEPSKVAASAIYLARATLGIRDAEDPCDKYRQGYFSMTLKYYSGYDANDLKAVVLKLHDKHKITPHEDLKSVYEKYKKEKFGSVALKPPVDRDLLISSFNGFQINESEK
mmetsp:Transcript_5035/g.9568  ORF Transcript_5035/g.9568 Transcript_5035/m.9568 type:complete len:634 (-) Transcript_5035:47-1948(-)